MATLRDKKKEQTRGRIQAASRQLFEKRGFEKTTMADIAAEAEIGLGTLYNYFPSKTAMFFSLIENNAGSHIQELERIRMSGKPLLESLQGFLLVYLKSFSTYDKSVWRDLFREGVFREKTGYLKIQEIDRPFIEELHKLLCDRLLTDDVVQEEKIAVASKAIYSLLGFQILTYISDEDWTQEQMIRSLMEQMSIVVAGISLIEKNSYEGKA